MIKDCQNEYKLTKNMLKIVEKKKMTHTMSFIPSVVEPSFGVGRVLYSLLEHAYWERPDNENRVVLSLPPLVAPYKCSVLPQSKNATLREASTEIHRLLKRANVSTRLDDSSASIGKRYSRSDEVGVPFGVTVDFQTLEDNTVTVR